MNKQQYETFLEQYKRLAKNDYWRIRMEETIANQEDIISTYLKQSYRAYDKALQQIIKDIAKLERKYSMMQLDSHIMLLNRNLEIRKYIEARLELLAKSNVEKQAKLYAKILYEDYLNSMYTTQCIKGVTYYFHGLGQKVIDELLMHNWMGRNYSDSIWNDTQRLTNKLNEVITSNMQLGKSIKNMTEDLQKVTNSSKYACARLVRTEVIHFEGLAQRKAYEESGIEKYRFMATLDERTCEKCGKLDGKVFLLSEAKEGINYPCLHPNTRSTTVAVINNNLPKERMIRDENGRSVRTEYMTYEDWKKKCMQEDK